ncbi:MAG: 2-phospho-L-lactate transferase [Pseudomonadota bacterium]|jgi:LPPG:FO 2-phospho-L-lactate transferase
MSDRYTVLTGGVGGAKLVDGLYRILPPGSLTAIVNTGDDFRHFGLPVSPDIDTLLYTLSGKANAELGWGRAGESWAFMAALQELGGEDWFNLGDGDLALHVLRRAALDMGETLTAVTARFATAWGLDLTVLPMSDDPVATWVETDEGDLPFQRYFVERRCRPQVSAIRFEGAGEAQISDAVRGALRDSAAIFIAPSNPWLSVDPVLAIPAIRQALTTTRAPIVAVSPLVGGKAVKGPTAKLMAELGLAVTNASIAHHYGDLLDAMIIHDGDDAPDGIAVASTNTLMLNQPDRIRVAQTALDLAQRLGN